MRPWLHPCILALVLRVIPFYPAVGDNTFVTFSPPGAEDTWAYDIDGSNIVGTFSYTKPAGQIGTRGFLLSGGGYESLDVPGADDTFAYGIDGEKIVGAFEDSHGAIHGYLYDGATFTPLDVPGAVETRAYGVYGDNIVGSFEDDDSRFHGFIYDGHNYTVLDVPAVVHTYAYGIDADSVVGRFWVDSPPTERGWFGFLYDGTSYSILDVDEPGDMDSTYAWGIDGSNVVGQLWIFGQGRQGFVYDSTGIQNTTYTIFDAPEADETFAFGIDGDNVVGSFTEMDGRRLRGYVLNIPGLGIAPVLGDMTGDGFVGADDLAILILNWNHFDADVAHGDITGDGFVGADDLSWMIAAWNTGTLPIAAATVPEPASMALLAMLLVTTGCTRRRN